MASELAGVKEELSNLLRDNPGRAGEDLVFGRTSRLINAARRKAGEAADAAYEAAKPPQGEITGWFAGQPIRQITDESGAYLDADALAKAREASRAVFRQFQKETGIDVSHITGVTAEDVAEIVGRPTAGEYEIVEEN